MNEPRQVQDLDRLVAVLAAEVESLHDEVEGAASAEDVARLARSLERLSLQINSAFPDGETGPAAPAVDSQEVPLNWLDVTTGQAGQWLVDLAGWVAAVVPHQVEMVRLPACWPQHPEVVQVLDALRLVWMHAHRSPRARETDRIEWHTRWWPDGSKLISKCLKCWEAKHKPPPTGMVEEVSAEALRYLAESHAARDVRPPGASSNTADDI